jgi:hypothetical protein
MYHRLKQAFCSVTRQSKFYQANALLSYAAKKDHEETNEVSILLPHMFIRTRPNCLEEIKKREDKTQSQTYKIYSIKQKEVYILIKNMESNHIPFYNNQSFFFFFSFPKENINNRIRVSVNYICICTICQKIPHLFLASSSNSSTHPAPDLPLSFNHYHSIKTLP